MQRHHAQAMSVVAGSRHHAQAMSELTTDSTASWCCPNHKPAHVLYHQGAACQASKAAHDCRAGFAYTMRAQPSSLHGDHWRMDHLCLAWQLLHRCRLGMLDWVQGACQAHMHLLVSQMFTLTCALTVLAICMAYMCTKPCCMVS